MFRIVKKKVEVSTCCGSTESSRSEPKAEVSACCCGKEVSGICCVKVLGADCKTCHQQYENVKEAVKNLGLTVEVEYLTDMEKVMVYGVMSMPVVVINETVAAYGKLYTVSQVEELLKKF